MALSYILHIFGVLGLTEDSRALLAALRSVSCDVVFRIKYAWAQPHTHRYTTRKGKTPKAFGEPLGVPVPQFENSWSKVRGNKPN